MSLGAAEITGKEKFYGNWRKSYFNIWKYYYIRSNR